jgi:hypothetical protein
MTKEVEMTAMCLNPLVINKLVTSIFPKISERSKA